MASSSYGDDVCNFIMKKILSEIDQEKHSHADAVFDKYMQRVFERLDDEFEISEAFYLFNAKKRLIINKHKQKRKRVAARDLHIATQFFTPRWLVEYVTDNSLGSFLGIPLKFFHGDESTIIPKDDIKIIDPAVGTGNMLIYAYELLEKYYRQKGVQNIPPKILSSLYGLDIDKKAVQVAKKLLEKKSGLKGFEFNIYAFEDIPNRLLEKVKRFNLKKLCSFFTLWQSYKEAGSLLRPGDVQAELKILEKHAHTRQEKTIIEIVKILSSKFDIVLMNPPYLSSGDYAPNLKEFVYKEYKDHKRDLFACFIKRGCEFLNQDGFLGAVCPYNWMFIKTFTKTREYIIKEKGIYNLMQLTAGGYDKAVVYLSAFALSNQKPREGYYIRLTDFKAKDQQKYALKAVEKPQSYTYKRNQDIFLQTPNYAIIYWTSQKFLDNFRYKRLDEYLLIRQGMATGDNKSFLRKIDEVDKDLIAFDAESIEDFDKSGKLYALYNKGGRYRKWWGNQDYVIKFDKASREILAKQGNKMPSKELYFKECITWTLVSSKGHFGARYSKNAVFDVGGSCAFLRDGIKFDIFVFLGFLCSKVATYYLNALNPTLNAQVGDIKNLPFIEPDTQMAVEITKLVKENIELSKADWYNRGKKGDFEKIKCNETRLNQIFIELYSLHEELDCQVEDRLITLKGVGNEE